MQNKGTKVKQHRYVREEMPLRGIRLLVNQKQMRTEIRTDKTETGTPGSYSEHATH